MIGCRPYRGHMKWDDVQSGPAQTLRPSSKTGFGPGRRCRKLSTLHITNTSRGLAMAVWALAACQNAIAFVRPMRSEDAGLLAIMHVR